MKDKGLYPMSLFAERRSIAVVLNEQLYPLCCLVPSTAVDKYKNDRALKIWDHDAITERSVKIGILGLGTLVLMQQKLQFMVL